MSTTLVEDRDALAWARIGQGNVDEAESTLREAIRLEPAAGEPHALLAIVFLLRGDAESARVSLERAEAMATPASAGTVSHARRLLRLATGGQAEDAELLRSSVGKSATPVLMDKPGG